MIRFATTLFWIDLPIFLIGTWILIKGSDMFVDAASSIARRWHVSELAIGLTLVSIGTSLPELATSLYAAFHGQSDFIIGNIAGSNVANISLILGLTLLFGGAMSFPRKLLKRDVLFMDIVFVVCVLFFLFGRVPGYGP